MKSNKEAGEGYSDIQIQIENEAVGMILEVKYAENEKLDPACQKALEQIEADGYTAELKRAGCHRILKYGIACFKKKCRVMVESEVYMKAASCP